ncbi:MAG: hypothetical protein WC901_04180 [Candidatus Margulisiibacteriota bacterium]
MLNIHATKKNAKTLFTLAMVGCLALAAPAFAARPLITNDFSIVSEGKYELEVGYMATENQNCSVGNIDMLLKHGIFKNLELSLEIPYTVSDLPGRMAGFDDFYLHAEYCCWTWGENEGLAVRADYKFNNGDISHGLSSGDNDYWLGLIVSQMFGHTKTHYNLGYVNEGYNAGRQEDDYVAYSAALEYPAFGKKGDLVAELVGNTSLALAPNPLFVQVGGRYVLVEGFKLDAAYGIGLNDNSIKNSFTAGMHWEL